MVGTSKILTVSYGTFSCTLEGFDDSFDTMKAIAEYFRDLAADDRYFGAEPPTPDADMLARIAEREISRRVEAHEDQGKIHLRAGAAPALPQEIETQPAEDEPVAEATDEVAEIAAAEEEPATEEAEEPATEEVEELAAEEPVAEEPAEDAEAAEITGIVDEAVAEEAPAEESEVAGMEPEAPAETPVAEDAPVADEAPEVEDAPIADTPDAADLAEAAEEDLSHIPSPLASDIPESYDTVADLADYETDIVEAQADVASDEASTETGAEEDSVAAKLRRIRSVVSQSDMGYEAGEYSEDEHAQDFLAETAADLDAALAADDAADLMRQDAGTDLEIQPEPEAEMAEAAPVGDAALLAGVADVAAPVAGAEQADAPEAPEAGAPDLEAPAETDPFEDTLAQILADAMPEKIEKTSEMTTGEASEEAGEALDTTTDDAPGAPDAAAVSARVVKMKRKDFEAAIADGLIEEDEDDTPSDTLNVFGEAEPGEKEEAFESMLSADDEAELLRELAEVEAELADEPVAGEMPGADDTPEPVSEVEADDLPEVAQTEEPATDLAEEEAAELANEDPASARRGEGRRKFEEAGDQEDLARIFDDADKELDKPESSKRRSAIQHLRAAVAATRAEKKAGSKIEKNVDDSPYRSDLASVVRPRRPESGDTGRSERPAESRPAPLKLVAEQRVDLAKDPIRPRRVSASVMGGEEEVMPATEDGGNFSDFAEEMGATALPELLEAAAAYMSDVEGRPQFSRPMLMNKLKEVGDGNYSREDGLRSFGQLLRQGKLQKLKGGRFAVTEETEFRAEARQAG